MRSALRYCIFLLLIFLAGHLHAQIVQKEANIWYFGRYLGLDFNSGTAVPLNDGQLNTTEGVATISNSGGNLLFYTDGIRIWNKLHQVMPNGTGLFGDPSSTQSAVIVQKIGDTTRYYVFTVDAVLGTRGLNYSVVNMTLDNGKGDVEVKNVPIRLNVVEKITAVKHCNNRDIWVVAHGSVSDAYYSYLVTAAGVNLTPVISHTGVVLPGIIPPSSIDSTWLGYMKVSPDGKKIAAAHWTVNADVSDFDNASGIVSNTVSLFQPGDPHYLVYGIEFSPDSRLVYNTVFFTDPANGGKRNALYQYDVTLPTPAAIRASKQVISQNSDPVQTYAALQIAPDGKMYMAKNIYTHIASISNPNVYGPGCNFTSNAIQWTGANQQSSFGLPTFVQSYFYPVDSFSHSVSCLSLTGTFNYIPVSNTLTIRWDFGDPASGANNTSTINNPTHIFSAPGTYNVSLIKFTNCGTDTLRKIISTDALNINLGADTVVCGSTSILLNASAAGSTNTFLWQNGSTNPTLLATTSGLYWVQASNAAGCTRRDSINVTFRTAPVYNLGPDGTICAGDSLTLNASATGAISYLWNTGAVTPTIKAFQAGTYWCDVNNGGCIFRDSLMITAVIPKPIVNFGNDITTCAVAPILLDATNSNCTYLWQNGSTNATLNATTSGLYWAEVRNSSGCIKRDSINITFSTSPVFNLGADIPICTGDALTLNATVAGAISYVWSTGATTPAISASLAGVYWCEVSNGGCVFRDSLTITAVIPKPVVNLGNDITQCGSSNIVLNATNPNSTYLWQDGSTNATLTATTSGLYWVEARNLAGCTKRDSINITFNPIPVFNLGANASICAGNNLTLNATVAGANSYLWSTGATTPTITASLAGLYWCEVSKAGCIFRDSLTITAVVPNPVVNLGNDITTCATAPIVLNAATASATYLWQDGSTNATFSATASGLYWAEVRNSSGCFTRDSINITFRSTPVFNLGADAAICAGDALTLNATTTGVNSYLWSTGATTPTINASLAGIYWCEVSNGGCTFRDSLTITGIKPLPVVNLGNDVTVCEGITVPLDATYLNSTYLWQNGTTNPVLNVTQQGTYSVQVDYNGCKKSDTITVNYNLKPRFSLGPDQLICQGNTLTLAPVLNATWQLSWQDGTTSPTHTITQPGTYTLSATNNCGATVDQMIVAKGLCTVFVPTGFTPNNDGKNDLFKALGTEAVTEFNLKIFNRGGQVVFESTDKNKGWDGKLGDQPQPTGVFIYLVRYKDIYSTNPALIKGTLTLIR
jgi:gliding motility-associated-like protein